MAKPTKQQKMKRWIVNCSVDGKVPVDSKIRPVACPINATHPITSVEKIRSYDQFIILTSGNGTKYMIYVEDNGQVKTEAVL